jgi:hypothetical protein
LSSWSGNFTPGGILRAIGAPLNPRRGQDGMTMSAEDKLALDTQLMDVYLTGLQSEIEAKLRRVAKFRGELKKIDTAGRRAEKATRQRSARALMAQVDDMLETNVTVRDMLLELKAAAEAVLKDLQD